MRCSAPFAQPPLLTGRQRGDAGTLSWSTSVPHTPLLSMTRPNLLSEQRWRVAASGRSEQSTRYSLPIAAPMSTTVSSNCTSAQQGQLTLVDRRSASGSLRWGRHAVEIIGCCLCCCRYEGVFESRLGGRRSHLLPLRYGCKVTGHNNLASGAFYTVGKRFSSFLHLSHFTRAWHSMHQSCRGDLPKANENKTNRGTVWSRGGEGVRGGMGVTGNVALQDMFSTSASCPLLLLLLAPSLPLVH